MKNALYSLQCFSHRSIGKPKNSLFYIFLAGANIFPNQMFPIFLHFYNFYCTKLYHTLNQELKKHRTIFTLGNIGAKSDRKLLLSLNLNSKISNCKL